MRILIVIVFFVCAAFAQLSPAVQALVKTMESMRNTSADPCMDFYEYACGTFIANNPIPANITEPTINLPALQGVGFSNDALLAKIVNDPWPFVSDLYESCMEPAAVWEKKFNSFFLSQVNMITYENSTWSTSDFWQLAAQQNLHLVNAFMDIPVEVNDEQQPMIVFMPMGITLQPNQYSNPQYYKPLFYEITQAFSLFEDSTDAANDATLVIKVEEFIAQATEVRNSVNLTLAAFSNMTGYDMTFLLNSMGVIADDDTEVLVQNPDYFAQLATNVTTTFGTRAVERYFEWRSYTTYSMYNMSSCVGTTNLPFVCAYVMSESPFAPPFDQAQVCRYFVHFMMEDYVGLIFTYEIVNEDTTGSIHNMTVGIQTAFNKSLPELDWLDTYSLDDVIFKLDHVIQIIGHPNVMDKYQNLTTVSDDLIFNIYNIFGLTDVWYNTFTSSPFNRSDYQFDPFIVNAFYSPNTNTINFPAGMLESPMFSGSWPKLFQYSRMGLVVGHENTHGFDNHGSEWNAFGLPGDIFDSSTRVKFNEAAVCIANYYSQFTVYGTTKLNGNQTLGENIADIGGTKNSYRAYQNFVAQNGPEFNDYQLISDLTVDQTFFLHMGQTWCATQNVEYLEMQMQDDVHSPAKFRVLGPLSQYDEFAAVFNCPANTPMNPTTRCDLW